MTIEISKQYTKITDPQRRVYNGCIYKSKQNFGPFEVLESEIQEEEIYDTLSSFGMSQVFIPKEFTNTLTPDSKDN